MFATIDRAEFPLITVTFTGEPETPDTFSAYLDGLLHNYDRREEIVLVFDATRALSLNPLYQWKQAQWMKQHEELISTYCKGVAYVIPNGMLRNTLGLIFRLQTSPTDFMVFSTLQDGKAWARGRLVAPAS